MEEIFRFFVLVKEKHRFFTLKATCLARTINDHEMGTTKSNSPGKTSKLRTKQAVFMLSEEEHDFIQFYLKKQKITNRSRWYRETIIAHVLRSMEQDYPTLFEENEMRR